MIIPIRCFSCGNPIAKDWDFYQEEVSKGHHEPKKVLDKLGYKRYCCRRMFLSHTELIDTIMQYKRF